MHVRHQFDSILALLSDDGGLTLVVLLFQSLVALPAVGVNCASRLDRVHDEGVQAVGRSVLDGTQPDAANAFVLNLNGDYNQGLVPSATAGDAILFSAHEGFIDFHAAVQPVASGPNHRAAQFVQPSPSRPVTTQP